MKIKYQGLLKYPKKNGLEKKATRRNTEGWMKEEDEEGGGNQESTTSSPSSSLRGHAFIFWRGGEETR